MALDGIAVAAIKAELIDKLLGGRIDKIHQPLRDEIVFSVRSLGENRKVLASANPSHPRIHITEVSKDNPMTPPLFAMVLRKHIAGGKIISISQPDFERIIVIEIQSMNEMGDITSKNLILEMMGKHSNLILTDDSGKILDAIKHISHDTSSVREVLPGKTYVFPPSQNKKNPLQLNFNEFGFLLKQQDGLKIQEGIYKNYTGISPVMASEICIQADLDPSQCCVQLTDGDLQTLFEAFVKVMKQVVNAAFSPVIISDAKTHKIIDFSVIPMEQYNGFFKQNCSTISEMLSQFYSQRDNIYHLKQKSYDIRRLILSNIERCVKKADIQQKTLRDISKMETWKIKGELLTANIYAVPKNATIYKAVNFYEEDMPEMEIALDPTQSPAENAQRYFNRYNKAKRTLAAMKIQKKQNDEELIYLESLLNALECAQEDADLQEIRQELSDAGFIKKRLSTKKGQQRQKKAKPLHFVSSDGTDIYVGKSNLQNDELTLRFAQSTDIWLHTKDIPGSHVIIRTQGTGIASDSTLLEAVNIAAFYSKAKNGSNVPVDYTLRKNVKKPSGAKPGFVIYEQNKTSYITPDQNLIASLLQE